MFDQRISDLSSDALLILQPTSVNIDKASQFRDADYSLNWDVGYMSTSAERLQVVFTGRMEFDVPE